MKKRKIVFIIILSIIVVMISGIIFICIWQNKDGRGNSVVISDKAYDMYIEINPIIKLSFKEQYNLCKDKNGKQKMIIA